MMALLLPWWRARSPREQVMLRLLAAVLAALLMWLAVLRPLAGARAAAEARVAAAATAMGEARGLAGAIRAAEARIRRSEPLPGLIERRLAEAGITAGTIEAQGDGSVRLVIAAVRAPVLIAWLGGLEQRDGLVIERAALARNSDPSVSATLVVRSAR